MSKLTQFSRNLRQAYIEVGAIDTQSKEERNEGFHRLDITLQMLKEFGHVVTINDNGTYTVSAGEHFKLS